MSWKKGIIWTAVGLFLAFAQSFFVSRWLTLGWVIVLSWREDNPWWLIFFVGLVSDLFLVEPLGKGVVLGLGIALAVKLVERLIGWKGEIKLKIKN